MMKKKIMLVTLVTLFILTSVSFAAEYIPDWKVIVNIERLKRFPKVLSFDVLHKPHPRNELLEYQIKQVIETLEKEALL